MPLSKDDPKLDYDGSWADASEDWPSISFPTEEEAKKAYVVAWRDAKVPYGSYVLVGSCLRLETAELKAAVEERLQKGAMKTGKSRGNFRLNDFHRANQARQQEAFAPPHPLIALVACVQEEVGELAAAVLGMTGEKKRKAHLGKDDVLDAVADAFTYLSLVAGAVDCMDLEALLVEYHSPSRSWRGLNDLFVSIEVKEDEVFGHVLRVQRRLGDIASDVLEQNNRGMLGYHVAGAMIMLFAVARSVGCDDLEGLLAKTFNMVSDRAGSKIKVEA